MVMKLEMLRQPLPPALDLLDAPVDGLHRTRCQAGGEAAQDALIEERWKCAPG